MKTKEFQLYCYQRQGQQMALAFGSCIRPYPLHKGYNGEHATSVNNSAHPSIEDMVAVGVKNKDF